MKSLLATAFASLLVLPAAFAGRSSMNISVSTDDFEEVTRCDQLHVTFDDEPGLRAEEQIDASRLRSLVVKADRNGGVRVTGWEGSGYQITACKAARTAAELTELHASLRGNELTASSPAERRSVIYFLVRAPRGADLNLEANNGEIAVHNVVSGTIVANTTNGPISIKGSSGTITADAQNGPINLAGGAGTVKLRAQNGPIGVKLSGSVWDGSIDAQTQNGPISLKLPRDYRSGVVVESDGHSPFSCRAEACHNALRTWDDDNARRVELGSGATVVRMSTHNGPVSVRDR
jgi:hypothetical protein